MKNLIAVIVIFLSSILSLQAQEMKQQKNTADATQKAVIQNAKKGKNVKTIHLEQVKGEFVKKTHTVQAGNYIFNIANNNVGHDVGFVLVKKGQDISNPENHIKTAYVTQPVANNSKGTSNVTTLEKGEYIYFCPLNPTATDNTLIVK